MGNIQIHFMTLRRTRYCLQYNVSKNKYLLHTFTSNFKANGQSSCSSSQEKVRGCWLNLLQLATL